MVSAWSILTNINFVRMDTATFEELLGMVAPLIIRNDAKIRQFISRTTRSDITVALTYTDVMLFKHSRCSYNSKRQVINSVVQTTLHTDRSYLIW